MPRSQLATGCKIAEELGEADATHLFGELLSSFIEEWVEDGMVMIGHSSKEQA